MSKPQHTQGPWKYYDLTSGFGSDGSFRICNLQQRDDIAKVRTKVDAQLISAAPEMLEALETALINYELYLQDLREDDAECAERHGYGIDYADGVTKSLINDIAELKRILAKARGEA